VQATHEGWVGCYNANDNSDKMLRARELTAERQTINVLYPFWGTKVGGSHLATLLLAKHLPAPYRPVFVLHEEGALSHHLKSQGFEYVLAPLVEIEGAGTSRVRLLLQIMASLPRLVRVLRTHSIDIVHANDGRMNVTWLFPARFARVAFVWHQHSRYRRSRFADFFARRAHAFIAVSQFCASNARAMRRGDVQIVRNPFERSLAETPIDDARRVLRRIIGASSEAVVLGFFGNLETQKRPEVFVDIVEMLGQRRPNAEIIGCLFGERREPLATRIDELVQARNLQRRVHLMGFRFPPERFMAGCDLIIASAAEESFGRTLIEAMLVGVPVVASRSGGHEEIICDGLNGRLAALDDVVEFADVAEHELSRPSNERRDLVERARRQSLRTISKSSMRQRPRDLSSLPA
jgi:glycosyltransferase involved in cell wall biosynthesis